MLSNLNLLHVDYDDAMPVLLRAQVLPFKHFHNGRDLSHVGDGRFLNGHAVACGAVGTHFHFGVYSHVSRCQVECIPRSFVVF